MKLKFEQDITFDYNRTLGEVIFSNIFKDTTCRDFLMSLMISNLNNYLSDAAKEKISQDIDVHIEDLNIQYPISRSFKDKIRISFTYVMRRAGRQIRQITQFIQPAFEHFFKTIVPSIVSSILDLVFHQFQLQKPVPTTDIQNYTDANDSLGTLFETIKNDFKEYIPDLDTSRVHLKLFISPSRTKPEISYIFIFASSPDIINSIKTSGRDHIIESIKKLKKEKDSVRQSSQKLLQSLIQTTDDKKKSKKKSKKKKKSFSKQGEVSHGHGTQQTQKELQYQQPQQGTQRQQAPQGTRRQQAPQGTQKTQKEPQHQQIQQGTQHQQTQKEPRRQQGFGTQSIRRKSTAYNPHESFFDTFTQSLQKQSDDDVYDFIPKQVRQMTNMLKFLYPNEDEKVLQRLSKEIYREYPRVYMNYIHPSIKSMISRQIMIPNPNPPKLSDLRQSLLSQIKKWKGKTKDAQPRRERSYTFPFVKEQTPPPWLKPRLV